MATYFDRRPSSGPRNGFDQDSTNPASPQTPIRPISSAISSPSVSFRAEEEPLIFEFGARHFSAGFAGEATPKCTLKFGPDESRRTGDHRAWIPADEQRPVKRQRRDTWGNDHELWRLDQRDVDLDLVSYKIERAVREAYIKHLLIDYKSAKKLILILPPVIPHQLLTKILLSLFQNPPSPPVITLVSPAMCSTNAAGCRSGLVIDIGWRETVITAVYEFREVKHWRTVRGMRMLTLAMAEMLERVHRTGDKPQEWGSGEITFFDKSFDDTENIVARAAWCQSKANPDPLDTNPEQDDTSSTNFLPGQSSSLPFSSFAEPVEIAFFPQDAARTLDDHERSLHQVVYEALLSLPPDVRATCMSRLIVIGGGSNIPGLKRRLLEELNALLNDRGWDRVYGKIRDRRRDQSKKAQSEVADQQGHGTNGEEAGNIVHDGSSQKQAPADLMTREPDLFYETYGRNQEMGLKPIIAGRVRGIESLGAWAGASLMAGLGVKGIVEVEKEIFLQHGLAGARRDGLEASVAASKGLGISAPKGSERQSWTLGLWA